MSKYSLKATCIMSLTLFASLMVRSAIDDRGFSDVRSAGLGGAGSAGVEGAAAAIKNPAALGFMAQESDPEIDNNLLGGQRFGWNILGAGLGGTLTGDLGDILQVLAETDFSRFERPRLESPENIKRLIELAGVLGGISENDTIVVGANLGSMLQIGHFGVGVRSFGQVGGWINDLDLVNLGLQYAADEIINELENAIINDGFDPAGYEYQTLDAGNIQKIRDAFGASLLDDDVIAYLDYKAAELVGDQTLDRDRIDDAVDTLAKIIEASGLGGNLNENSTSITGRGFLGVEIPVGYGYAFNDNFALGVTARAIFGRVFGTQVWAFNEDNSDIIENSLDSSVDRVALGLDLSAMYRLPNVQFALSGYNLNRPRFEGYQQEVLINGKVKTIQVPDVVLDPQVTFGAAWIPNRRFMLAGDFELLETGTLIRNYDIQRFSVGSELDLSLVVLRLGTYRNIAESDIGWVLTGGLGFQLWAVSVDAGAAVSIDDTVQYDGTDYPRTLRLHLGIAMDF